LVLASIVTGVILTAAAMWCFKTKDSKLLAAVLFTVAVCTLHFTAMRCFEAGRRAITERRL
jgi:NO-binding membrane sensor protein with MHYT domain